MAGPVLVAAGRSELGEQLLDATIDKARIGALHHEDGGVAGSALGVTAGSARGRVAESAGRCGLEDRRQQVAHLAGAGDVVDSHEPAPAGDPDSRRCQRGVTALFDAELEHDPEKRLVRRRQQQG